MGECKKLEGVLSLRFMQKSSRLEQYYRLNNRGIVSRDLIKEVILTKLLVSTIPFSCLACFQSMYF